MNRAGMRSTRQPKTFGVDVTRAELIRYIRQLERELEALDNEQDALDTCLAQLRSCRDRGCGLCKACVTALFIRAKPAPLALPAKYVVGGAPWRKY